MDESLPHRFHLSKTHLGANKHYQDMSIVPLIWPTLKSKKRRRYNMKIALHSATSSLQHGKAMWMLIGIGAALAAEIAAVLSLTFLGALHLGIPLSGWGLYLILAPLSGLIVGLFMWWLFIVRLKRVTVGRGVLFGGISSIIAHPFVWGLVVLLAILTKDRLGDLAGSSIFGFFQIALPFSLISLFYTGWITTLVGCVAGGLLLYLQRVLSIGSQRQGEPAEKDSTGA